MTVTTQLDTLVGEKVKYNKNVISVLSYKTMDDTIYLNIKRQDGVLSTLTYTKANIIEFLRNIEIVDQTLSIKPKDIQMADESLNIYEKANVNASDLIKTLMGNIEKVQNDPAYVPVAAAVNNNVNTIINIMKLQIDTAREVRKSLTPKK